MDFFVNEKDFTQLQKDKYTFAVLDRILRGNCEIVCSDHENLILCHSAARYPVWIWTPDGCTESIKEHAWTLADECRPVSEGYHFNMKYELAEYFIRKAAENVLLKPKTASSAFHLIRRRTISAFTATVFSFLISRAQRNRQPKKRFTPAIILSRCPIP